MGTVFIGYPGDMLLCTTFSMASLGRYYFIKFVIAMRCLTLFDRFCLVQKQIIGVNFHVYFELKSIKLRSEKKLFTSVNEISLLSRCRVAFTISHSCGLFHIKRAFHFTFQWNLQTIFRLKFVYRKLAWNKVVYLCMTWMWPKKNENQCAKCPQ